MDFHPLDIVISIINIAVLFILLRLILWKHIDRFLQARSERIKSEHANIETLRLEAEALKKEYEEKIEGIELREHERMRETEIRASEEEAEILAEAREKARSLLSEARDRIAEEKERAILSAEHEIAQLATDMAARILRREVSGDDTKFAVEEFFRETNEPSP